MVISAIKRHIHWAYAGFALLVAILYDGLFWKQHTGINVFILGMGYLFGFLTLMAMTGVAARRRALWLMVPVAVFGIEAVLYTNDFTADWAPFFVALVLVLITILVTLGPAGMPARFTSVPLVRSIDLTFSKWGAMYRDLFRNPGAANKDIYKKIAYGVVVAMPLLIIFAALFSSADAVFGNWLEQAADIHLEASDVWRVFRTLVMAWFLLSIVYVVFSSEYTARQPLAWKRKFDPTVLSVVLALVNLLFASFVAIQVKYLFGDWDFVLESGLTFADYARQGFFQLVAVMVIAGLLLLASYRAYAHSGSKALAALKLLLLAQVVVIGISALQRMNLYQQAYGYTVLRLYVEWFIYFLFALVVLLGASIVRRREFHSVLNTVALGGLAGLMIVGAFNVDALIARENVRRFIEEGKTLDVQYLGALSSDVIPELAPLLGPGSGQGRVEQLPLETKLQLYKIYESGMNDAAERERWGEWHWGAGRTYSSLAGQMRQTRFAELRRAYDRDRQYGYIERQLLKAPRSRDCSQLPAGAPRSGASMANCAFVQTGDRLYVFEELSLRSYGSDGFRYTVYYFPSTASELGGTLILYAHSFPRSMSFGQPNGDSTLMLGGDGAVVERNYPERRHFRHELAERAGKFSLHRQEL